MKNKDFGDLLKSIDQARKIHAGKMKARRVKKPSHCHEGSARGA